MTNAFLAQLERRLLDTSSDLTHLDVAECVSYVRSKASSLATPIITESELRDRWSRSNREGAPLRIKFGIDPTGPEMHLGHAVPLLNLRRYLRLGCAIEFVVGDFTALIGDPSGRNDERPAITEEQVADNMRSYREQARRVLDVDHARVRWSYNRSWMTGVDLLKWRELTSGLSAADLFQRADFRARLAAGHSLSLAELEYAVYMAYDSVVLQPDVEVGGIDQLLNMQVCRRLMESLGQVPEVIVTYDLLPGTTNERDAEGRPVKMSKSRANFIPVAADPREMYGLTMSVPDAVMWDWYRNLTEISGRELEELKTLTTAGDVHPKAAKELLARTVVATFHADDPQASARAAQSFNAKYGRIQGPGASDQDIVDVVVNSSDPLFVVLARASGQSNAHVRRIAAQRGIRRHPTQSEPVVMSPEEVERPAILFAGQVVRMGRHLLVRPRPGPTS